MSAKRLATAGPRAWRLWLRTIIGAVAANLVVRAAGRAVFDVPAEFEPLATAGPTVFLTVVGVTAGLVVAVRVGRRSASPVPTYRRIVVAALLVSLLPDFWLLTEGAAEGFPGATVPAVTILIVQHVAAAAVVLWTVTGPPGQGGW